VRSPRDSAIAGVGISIPIMSQASLFLRYDGEYSGTSQNHSGSAGFRYSFGAPPPAMPPVPPAPMPPAPPAVQQQTFVVFFDFDKSTLTPEGAKVVDAAIAQAKRGQATRIQVNGYTDTVGTVQYNLALSQRRAKTVHDYMVAHGIPDQEIDAQGFGKTHLRVPTADGVREAQNRRVEIVF
jgi:outer membrane protein OmpA-like peptidoglycan-associated protein